jgi:hypothetical protein
VGFCRTDQCSLGVATIGACRVTFPRSSSGVEDAKAQRVTVTVRKVANDKNMFDKQTMQILKNKTAVC